MVYQLVGRIRDKVAVTLMSWLEVLFEYFPLAVRGRDNYSFIFNSEIIILNSRGY